MRGVLVGGKYRITERIGQGGMGMVYRAAQSGLNRDVALKILKRELYVDPATVARFHREANAMSLLAHPNTVRVFDFGQTDDGLLYLAMELLEGERITERLTREGSLDVLEALRFTQQILRSLAEAHRKALVHRDLKPDNIFLAVVDGQAAPVVKVLDFGIAKIVAPDRRLDQFETQAGTVFGTPRYMSPEQAQGAPLDGRSDLYSVGTLLYQMLTGRAPFVDLDAVVVMAKHIREVPDAPRVAAPERPIPASLDRVVLRALAKNATERFQDATEFEVALEACVPDVLTAGAPPPVATIPGLGPRRRLAMLWIVALAAVLALVGYATSRSRSPDMAQRLPRLTAAAAAHDATARGAVSHVQPDVPATAAQEKARTAASLVSLRSEPDGAIVFRDGKRLGNTPFVVIVEPDEEFVRVELRANGYLPRAAELSPADGTRTVKLAPRRRPVGPRASKPPEKRPTNDPPQPVSPYPYERFE